MVWNFRETACRLWSSGGKKLKNFPLVSDTYGKLLDSIQNLRLDRYSTEIDPKAQIAALDRTIGQIKDYVKRAEDVEQQVSSNDPIRDELDRLFDGKIGLAPLTQEQLDELCVDADTRYEREIPPGFSDAKKEQVYVYDGLLYQAKYGDLILWRQLIAHIKKTGSSVMLVTSDKKADWWWQEKDGATKTIGPHTHLMREIKKEANIDLFWMYSADKFLEHAATKMANKVSRDSVEQVRDIVNTNEQTRIQHSLIDGDLDSDVPIKAPEWVAEKTNPIIAEWLAANRGSVLVNRFGPDFVVRTPDGDIYYDVLRVPNFHHTRELPLAAKKRLLGLQNELRKRPQSSLGVIIVLDPMARISFFGANNRMRIMSGLKQLTNVSDFAEFILGIIDSSGQFKVLLEAMPAPDGLPPSEPEN